MSLEPKIDLVALRGKASSKAMPVLCVVQTTETRSVVYSCTTDGKTGLREIKTWWCDNATLDSKGEVGASAQKKLYKGAFKASKKTPGMYTFNMSVIQKLNLMRAKNGEDEIQFKIKVHKGVPSLNYIVDKKPYTVDHVVMDLDIVGFNVRKFNVHCRLRDGEDKSVFTIDVPPAFVSTLNLGFADMV